MEAYLFPVGGEFLSGKMPQLGRFARVASALMVVFAALQAARDGEKVPAVNNVGTSQVLYSAF